MFSQDQITKLLKTLECVAHKTHECLKDIEPEKICQICELGYIYIAEQPLQLSCGHCVCTNCTSNAQKMTFKCKNHNEVEVIADAHMARLLIENNLNVMFPILKQKYDATMSLFQGTNIRNYFKRKKIKT